ncbi:NotI family restriction endonuclease [Gemmata sp. JC673]|uniref:NotI family restriction endonuclease n=1 Tax=Gemmata algarum TaxID=2975278 RepID=A0ABU5F6W8_9BACT|nr:NotI family restriction endonuclease [Gemmata algarum]MDY3563335.1 NotI family restriction endonuclease [Gemmata algarum]
MNEVAELYGLPTDYEPAGQTWAGVVSAQQCPYLNRKCLKNRKSEPDRTIGTCTMTYGKDSNPLMICPFRLLERRQIFEDCKPLVTLHQPGNEWHLVAELEVPGGSVDYCLASVRKKKVMDFIGIELQTLDSTGTVWPERQRFLHSKGIDVREEDRKSTKPFGMNWKMTAKTALVQMHHKIQTFEHLSKKLVLVLQDHLLAYMRQEFTFDHLVNARLGDPMHFHSYSLCEEDGGLKLELEGQYSTDTAGIARCLGLQSEAKLELEAIVALIEAKISDKTLMSIETPPPAPSLAEKATEEES